MDRPRQPEALAVKSSNSFTAKVKKSRVAPTDREKSGTFSPSAINNQLMREFTMSKQVTIDKQKHLWLTQKTRPPA
jgi:hypothetical protein